MQLFSFSSDPASGPSAPYAGIKRLTADSTGNYSLTLDSNSTITPANTYWQVIEGNYAPFYISVPVGAGPFRTVDIKVTVDPYVAPPPPLPAVDALAAHVARVSPGAHNASAVSISPIVGLSATTVQDALALLRVGANVFTWHQNSAATSWVINHNLGYNPGGIFVQDSTGRTVLGWVVTYTDVNNLTITFSAAIGGQAVMS